MKLLYRSLALLMTVLILFGSLAISVSASDETGYIDTGQESIEDASGADAEITTSEPIPTTEEIEAETPTITIGPAEDESSADEPDSGTIQLDETTTIEYEEYEEDTRAEAMAEIMSEAAGEAIHLAEENELLAPDDELLDAEDDAVLRIQFKDPASAVSVQTDDGTAQTANLYYMSDSDGQLYSLAPDDLAVEVPVETDENGCAMIPMQIGTSVHLSVIEGYGHVIASATLTTASGETIIGSDSFSYDFIISEDMVLEIETEEVGVNIPGDEDAVEGIQVMEKNGEFINDPTVDLPAELPNPGSSIMLKAISSSYWGTIEARYEGGGSHPYPNGNSTGVFTVWYNDKSYTGVCIDPSYAAPGSGYLNEWREWNYYNVPLKDNPTFFAAIASSYYSNYGSTSGTVAYINLRDRTNWDQVGAYMYSHCGWGNVVDNPTYGHGFAMYHELLGYLANGWSWDRSVLGSSGIKSYIVSCCNKIYDLINPNGDEFWQYAYNVLYTYRVFYYQSTTAGRQRVAWTVPRTDYGQVKITKLASKTGEPLPGCTITLTDVNDPNHKFTATTDENGLATFNWVTWTTYTVEETVPPEGFAITYAATNVAFTASYNIMSIDDDPEGGELKIIKTSDDGMISNITFTVKNNDTGETQTVKTGSDGTFLIEDLAAGTYTVTETVDAAYIADPVSQVVTVETGKTAEVKFSNTLKKFRGTLTKVDKATGAAQGDATLAGAVYGLYRNNTEIARFTTDANGQFTTGYFACGSDWTLKEIAAPMGYTLDTTVHSIGAAPGNFTVSRNTISTEIQETVITGQIEVIKKATNSVADTSQNEDGATFEVYLKSAGSYTAAKETERDTLTTASDGHAKSKLLPYGTYIVHQTSGWEGHIIDDQEYELSITTNGQVVSVELENEIYKGTLLIIKQDKYTTKPLAGATFQIKNSDDFIVAELTTGEDGIITVENLVFGEYTYQETKAPDGYQLDETVYDFKIEEDGQTVEHTRENLRIPGSIAVLKTDNDGRPLSGVIYLLEYSTDNGRNWSPVTSRTGDNVTVGGCTSSGLSDGKLITGSDGIAKFEGLRADGEIQYKLTEVATQNGHTLLKDPVYKGTLPVDGDSDPIYDISATVKEGSVFGLPMTGSRGFSPWIFVLSAMLASVGMVAVYATVQIRRSRRHSH